jgi:hypothetical protein
LPALNTALNRGSLFVFVLAAFLRYQLIKQVSPLLHSPLNERLPSRIGSRRPLRIRRYGHRRPLTDAKRLEIA